MVEESLITTSNGSLNPSNIIFRYNIMYELIIFWSNPSQLWKKVVIFSNYKNFLNLLPIQ